MGCFLTMQEVANARFQKLQNRRTCSGDHWARSLPDRRLTRLRWCGAAGLIVEGGVGQGIAGAGSNAALPMPSLRQGLPTKTPPATKARGSLAGIDSSNAIWTQSSVDPIMVPSLKD
jgi:hypothetical protein